MAQTPDIAEALLAHLRDVSGDAGLQYASPPTPLGGGFSGAVILAFELESPPAQLAGPLVLRMVVGNDGEMRQRREAALQDAAGKLGCAVPRIRLTGDESVGLGGVFFVMDRLEGAPLVRWSVAIGLFGWGAGALLWQGWPVLVGIILGGAAVGITMGIHQRRIHQLRVEDVRRVYTEHGLQDADVDVDFVLQLTVDAIDEAQLEHFRPGLQWLRDNAMTQARPTLCHGDIQPLNFMASWTEVTGIIDWETACIADPEYDVAVVGNDLLVLPGPWLAPLLWPTYWSYLLYVRSRESLDAQRLRYYGALRSLLMLSLTTRLRLEQRRLRSEGARDIPGPDLPRFFARMLLQAQIRCFHGFTGIRLTPYVESWA